MLQVENLSCARGPRELFRDLSFTVSEGELVLVTGPNGSGKTTLLRAMAGLTRPASGTISWSDSTRSRPAAAAYVGHAAGWKDSLTVAENLRLAWALDGEEAAGDKSAADSALQSVGLARQRNLDAGRLSQGQKKRLHLARLSRSTRPLWLLDEPAAALDDEGLGLLSALVAAHLRRDGMAAIATHQPLPIAGVRTQSVALTG